MSIFEKEVTEHRYTIKPDALKTLINDRFGEGE